MALACPLFVTYPSETMTRHLSKISFILAVAVLATGCASTPNPAKVCTTDWIAPRVNKAVDRIETKAGRSLRALKGPAKAWSQGKTPNPFQLLTLQSSLKKLERELTDGRGIKDLRTVARTCDDPVIVTDALRGMWKDNGFPDALVDFVERSGIYEKVLGDLTSDDVAT